jgi:hypothetical protein
MKPGWGLSANAGAKSLWRGAAASPAVLVLTWPSISDIAIRYVGVLCRVDSPSRGHRRGLEVIMTGLEYVLTVFLFAFTCGAVRGR